jgi:hypothetical protein
MTVERLTDNTDFSNEKEYLPTVYVTHHLFKA